MSLVVSRIRFGVNFHQQDNESSKNDDISIVIEKLEPYWPKFAYSIINGVWSLHAAIDLH